MRHHLLIIALILRLNSYGQVSPAAKPIEIHDLYGTWSPYTRKYMTIIGLEDSGDSYMNMLVTFDSTKATLFDNTFNNARYSVKKAPTQKALESNYTFQAESFEIKSDSIYIITILSEGISKNFSKNYIKNETVYLDGKKLYVERNGVIFLLNKKRKNVQRSSR